ncbi:MAG: PIN domain-containing protein [Chitinophagales bacterium]
MIKIVVDTNIVFSAILNTNTKIGDLLLNSTNEFEFYSASYLKTEIERHKDKLVKISGLQRSIITEIQHQVFHSINFISEELIPFEIWQKAVHIVRDVDMDDIAFIALCEYLNAILWTGDKVLLRGIRAKGYNKGNSTEQILMLRNNIDI